MAEDKLQKLKEKYVSVISVMNRQDFRVQNVHVENDKLLIKAEAPSQNASNEFWNAVRRVDPDYSKDLNAQITVKPQQASGKVTSPPPSPKVEPVSGKQGEAGSGGQTYTVVKGDTLSEISQRFYGNANEYMRIFEANRDKLKDPDKIQVGQVLKIPAKTGSPVT